MPRVERCLVHTGRHYDRKFSGNFFEDLGLPEPDMNLDVGSRSHTRQPAEIVKPLEPVLKELQPALLIVAGDVNFTLRRH